MEVFVGCFSELADPREDNTRHDSHEMLLIALCALLCGGEDCSDMALFGRSKEGLLRQTRRLKHGVPRHDNFSRLFRHLDPTKFHACFLKFINSFTAGLSGVVAVDGSELGPWPQWGRVSLVNAAPLFRPGVGKVTAASGQRLGL